MRRNRWPMALAAGLVLAATMSAYAVTSNAANGKKIFMTKGQGDKACMTCHPKGLTTGDTYRGKDIPDLTERELRERKLRSKTEKFLKVQGMTLSDADMEDLLTFVRALPSQGFGSVPPEWRRYVQEKAAQ
jgi:cytochrome c553